MADFNLPTLTTAYADFLAQIKLRDEDIIKMLDGTTSSNIPSGAKRWNSISSKFEKYNGTTWSDLSTLYNISVTSANYLNGGNNTTLLGAIPYQSNANITTLLSPNTTTIKKFLRQTGTGTNGAAPVWDTINASDIPILNQSTTGNAATATTANSLNTANSYTVSNLTANGSLTIGSNGNYVAGSIYSDSNWGMIFRAKQASPAQAIFRWDNAAGAELFRWNGSALTCSVTGNAATATKLTNSSGDWVSSGASANVVGMLSWKNYGNGHVIFDASAGTAPNGAAINNSSPQNGWASTYPTLMGWNGSQTYGVRVDAARYSESCTGNAATATYAAAFTTAVGGAPSYACRAWVNFNGTGTVAIRASGNVSSITDNGVGNYTVNFATAMADANYSVSSFGKRQYGTPYPDSIVGGYAISASQLAVYTTNGNGAYEDFSDVHIHIVR